MQLNRFSAITGLCSSLFSMPLTGVDQFPSIEKASFYQHHSQQQWEVAYNVLHILRLKGHEHVLDIGCGSGKITANIAGRVPSGHVIGVDLSQGMIEFAKDNYEPYYSNLTFDQSDIFEFDAPSAFDVIFSSGSLHWILDHQQLLTKVHNLLNDQGKILFSIPCTPFPEVSAVFRDIVTNEPWLTYLQDYNHPRRKFTAEEYTLLLTQAGFHDIKISQEPFTYYFESKRELADWYAAFSPMLFYIPQEMHETFLVDMVERYLQSYPLDETGRIMFKQNELIIQASKF